MRLADDPLQTTATDVEAQVRSTAQGRIWEWAGLFAVTVIAAFLRLYKLDQNGTGNAYYGAAVRSMLVSWTNFFFGSFDPAGIVTVDKPPVALWIQALSARLLGYSGVNILLPQACMGVVSVILTYRIVRRVFGAGSGLLSGLVLAITPICVAMDRDNLPDTALVLVLLLATQAILSAGESGRLGPLLGSMALVGLAFNIKMLAAFVVMPTYVLAYWLAAPIHWRTKVARLSAAAGVLIVTSLSWSITVELTPKDRRPYIGGSRNNSAIELALGYNGLLRIMGRVGMGRPGGPPPIAPSADSKADPKAAATLPPPGPPPGFGPGGPMGMPGFGGTPGFRRFANRSMSGLITWLFPMAVLGSILAATRTRWTTWPVGREALALIVWGGWFATHWVVFSFAQGIFHEYYTTVMGPAVAAMAGIGAMALWETSREGGWRAILLPAALVLTAGWQVTIVRQYPDWKLWLMPTILGMSGLGALGVIASTGLARRWGSVPWFRAFASVGLAALLISPALWSLSAVLAKGSSMLPTADPSMMGVRRDESSVMGMLMPNLGGPGGPFESNPSQTKKLVDFLVANRKDEPILVASLDSMSVAPLIIDTGEPAVSIGGFMGGDPAMTKDQFVAMVESGRLRFFYIGGGPGGGGGGPPPGGGPFGGGGGGGGPPEMPSNREITAWVREHGKLVDPKLWKLEEPVKEPEAADKDKGKAGPAPGFNPMALFARFRRSTQLYDLRPDHGH